MKQIEIEGNGSVTFGVVNEKREPFEIARELMGNLDRLSHLPDSAKVTLSEQTVEKYMPPRCRKPRDRLVTTPIMTWTLGGLPRQTCRIMNGSSPMLARPAGRASLSHSGDDTF